MRVVFADTFYFLGLLNENDQYAERVFSFEKTFRGKIVTSDWIFMEVADAFCASSIRKDIRNYVLYLKGQPSFEIVPGSRDLFDRALNFYHRHADKAWSLTDCTSFVIMRDMGIKEALTGDKHFEQAGFAALLS